MADMKASQIGFALNDEQKMLQQLAREFARNEIAPVAEIDRAAATLTAACTAPTAPAPDSRTTRSSACG